MADTQLHIDDERVQIVEQDDFMALVRALRRAQGFALYFVECNVPVYRRDVSEAVRDRLDRPVVDVHLGEVNRRSERPSIDSILGRQIEDAPEEAVVFVWELEWLLPITEVDRDITQTTLREVNWRRGTYADLGRPLVVWLPEYAIRYLARNAPDFFDWNSGLYVFETPESDRPDLFETPLDVLEEEGTAESLPTEEKRRREAYLKSLLEEYSGDSDFDRDARANILLRLTELYVGRASYDRARSCARQALDLARTIEDRGGEARARHDLATIALRQGDYKEARSEFGEALGIRRQIGDRKGEAETRNDLATVALNQGNYEEAQEGIEEALRIYQEVGHRKGEATTRHNLATIALKQGEYGEAREKFTGALRIYQETGNRKAEARTRHELARIALRQKEYDKAQGKFREMLQASQKIGDRSLEAMVHHNLATTAAEQGIYEGARHKFEEALRIRQQIGDRHGEAQTFAQLGILAANGFSRKREGLRLLHVSYSILISIEHAQVEQVGPWIQGLANELGYDEEELGEDRGYALSSYAEDRGWTLIQAAFPDADIPEDGPPGD